MHVWAGAATPAPGWTTPVQTRWPRISLASSFKVPLVDARHRTGLHPASRRREGPRPRSVPEPGQHGATKCGSWKAKAPIRHEPHYVLPGAWLAAAATPATSTSRVPTGSDERHHRLGRRGATANTYTLHYAPDGGLTATDSWHHRRQLHRADATACLSDAVQGEVPAPGRPAGAEDRQRRPGVGAGDPERADRGLGRERRRASRWTPPACKSPACWTTCTPTTAIWA